MIALAELLFFHHFFFAAETKPCNKISFPTPQTMIRLDLIPIDFNL